MNPILKKLTGGDLRSEGKADEVAKQVVGNSDSIHDLLPGLDSGDNLLRARTCMAMEIISQTHPDILKEAVPQLIALAAVEIVPQARWHLAEIFGNVPIPDQQREMLIPVLLKYLEDKSKIVQCCSVMTLGLIGQKSPKKNEIIQKISKYKDVSKSMNKAVIAAAGKLSAS